MEGTEFQALKRITTLFTSYSQQLWAFLDIAKLFEGKKIIVLYKGSLLHLSFRASFYGINLYDTKWFISDPVHKESKYLSC